MRFKLYYNEATNELDFNCLKDNNTDIILPDNPDQHIYYPVPDELRDDIHTELLTLIDQEIAEQFSEINDEVQELMTKRRVLMSKIRKQINPLVMKKLLDFKEDNAEYFI